MLTWEDYNEISSIIGGIKTIQNTLDSWRCWTKLDKEEADSLYVICYALGAAVKELSHKIEEMEREGHHG